MSGFRRVLSALACGLALWLAVVGCSGEGGTRSTEARVRDDGSGEAREQEESFGELAEAEAPAGSSAFCHDLVASAELVGLGEALAGLADPATRPQAVRQVGEATAALRAVDVDADLEDDVDEVAGALEEMAAGDLDAASVEAAMSALDQLGEEVQALCDFPQG